MSAAGTIVEGLRAQLERCARRFHSSQNLIGAAEHKYWRFENCPAPACREARSALDITAVREPGEDG